MAIGDIIIGVDIGTSKVSLVVGEVNNFNQIEVTCNTSHKCNGIRKTKIVDEDEVALAIHKVISEAEQETDLKIHSAYVTIPGKYVTIVDRKEAIKYVIDNGQPGDVIVLAGKGHEDYQEIKGEKFPMDERDIIRDILAEKK